MVSWFVAGFFFLHPHSSRFILLRLTSGIKASYAQDFDNIVCTCLIDSGFSDSTDQNLFHQHIFEIKFV